MKKNLLLITLTCLHLLNARAWWHELTFDNAHRRYVTPTGVTVTRDQLIAYAIYALNHGQVQEAQRWVDMAIRTGAQYQDFKNVGLKPALHERHPQQCVRIHGTPYYLC